MRQAQNENMAFENHCNFLIEDICIEHQSAPKLTSHVPISFYLAGRVAKGTSRYGSGVLGLFRPSYERRLVEYCIDLYTDLQVYLETVFES